MPRPEMYETLYRAVQETGAKIAICQEINVEIGPDGAAGSWEGRSFPARMLRSMARRRSGTGF